MNIVNRELKAHRKSLVIWSFGIIAIIASGMSKYAGMESSGQSINKLMGDMPKIMQAIMGTGSLDLTTPLGFYGVLYLYLVIMLTIHAAMLGATIVAKEERDKTVEFLIAKPITRTYIITSKLIASIIQILVLNIISLIFSIIFVARYSDMDVILQDIVILTSGLLLLQFIFLTVGSGIAAASKKQPKSAPTIAAAILLFTFLLSIGVDMNENLGALKFFTPFKYVVADKILNGHGIDPISIVLSFVIIIGMLAVTYIFYNKKDLHV
ncbi:ABC transporter permease subunit [Aquibacillus halophilus]|uniref:ABC transporter permease subunit n=1 Tax=Aquibacillus halophilus TaxID=930132 RepID=A0A6A8DDB9_9BACI|nr:ABC transporter permease subunit [Aquibacillus halophilus]